MWLKQYSLYIFLPTFLLIGILTMIYEIRVDHELYQDKGKTTGRSAHRPAEFPEIFKKLNPLEGLDPKEKASPHNPDTAGTIHVAKPPLDPETWPCSQCHDKGGEKDNPKKRTLEEHTQIVLKHGERWCLDCHDFKDRDKLHLANGDLISFDESYKLCGQCHGPTYKDWRLGIHGKRTGYWNGPKRYMLCVSCHWPHEPHFKPLKPLPAPVRPNFLRNARMVELKDLPAATASPSATPSASATATPSTTPSPSASPSASPTASSTATPTPKETP